MPSIFSHAIFGAAIGKVYAANPLPPSFWVLTAGCAMLPDVDVFGLTLGIPHGSMLGHRGMTHSLCFAVVVGCLAGWWMSGSDRAPSSRTALILYFIVVTATHPLLDAMTNGGSGVALLAPFDPTRYFFPWRPIEVSPIGLRFFSARGLATLASEIKWVWVPSVVIVLAAWGCRWALRKRAGS